MPELVVVRAMWMRSRQDSPGPVKIELKDVKSKGKALRQKFKLQKFRDGHAISRNDQMYLRNCKLHTDRLIELKIKQILKMVPNGEQYRVNANGRIMKRSDNSRPRNTDIRHTDEDNEGQSSRPLGRITKSLCVS